MTQLYLIDMDYKNITIHNGIRHKGIMIFATLIIVTVAFTFLHIKSQTVCAPVSTYYRVSHG